jgi:hypothetical protein
MHASTRSRPPTARTLLALGAVGAGYYTLTVLAMHAVQPEVDPLYSTGLPSEYALGRWGWLVGLGFVVFGLGVLAFAVGLRMTLSAGRRATASAVLFGINGLGLVGAGLFTTDPPLADGTVGYTISGQMHALFGLLAGLSLIVGLFLLRGVLARDPRWRSLAMPTRWMAWLMIASLVAEIVTGATGFVPGLVARIFFPLPVIWLVAVVLRLRRVERQPAAPVP